MDTNLESYSNVDPWDDEAERLYNQSKAERTSGGVDAYSVGKTALMSGGNPYLIAGMVGLQMLEANKQRKQRNKELAYQERVLRRDRQTAQLANMAKMGSGLGL